MGLGLGSGLGLADPNLTLINPNPNPNPNPNLYSEAKGFLLAETTRPPAATLASSEGMVSPVAVQSMSMPPSSSAWASRKVEVATSADLAVMVTPLSARSASLPPPALCARIAAIASSESSPSVALAMPLESHTAFAQKRSPYEVSWSSLAPTMALSSAAPTPPEPRRVKGTLRHVCSEAMAQQQRVATQASAARERMQPRRGRGSRNTI